VKIRGHAQHIFEKYQQLARDASSSGDRVLAENYLQHAEHYYRVLRTLQPQRPASDFVRNDGFSGSDMDFEDEGEGGQGGGEGEGESQGAGEVEGDQPRRDDRQEFRQDRGDRDQNRDRNDQNRDRDRDQNRDRDRQGQGGQGQGQNRDREWRRDDRPDGRDRDGGQPRQDNQPRQDSQPREGGQPRSEGRDRDGGRDRFEPRAERGPERNDEPRRDRFEGRRDREPRRDDRGDAPREPQAYGDREPAPAPVAREAAPDDSSTMLRGQDGALSAAPAFLQAPAAGGEEAVKPKPKPRARRPRAETPEEA
jgi:hypothetical protein